MGKAASTFLQYHVFPCFKGLHYIQRTRYVHAREIIRQGNHERYLLSREFDRQLEEEIAKFAKDFPHAHLIIIFRRHGSWIASQYRRWVKNGYPFPFDQFFNLQDTGDIWKTTELRFYQKLEAIEQHYGNKPLVLFYEDMKAGPVAFVQAIAAFCGATVDEKQINFNPKHRSYSQKQLIFARRMNRLFHSNLKIHFNSKLLETLRRLLRMSRSYAILFLGKILPPIEQGPLIPEARLKEIDEYFEEDWRQCRQYAQKQAFHQQSPQSPR
jgi:hypothetical protein